MKQIKNSNIRRTSFQDAFFVRMKIQNSIHLPKYSTQTHKQHQTTDTSICSHIYHKSISLRHPKPEPFIERAKKSQRKLSKQEVNQWITQKQAEFQEIIKKYHRFSQLFIKAPSSDEKIFLRTPSELSQLSENSKSKRQYLCSDSQIKDQENISFEHRYSMARNRSGKINNSNRYENSPKIERKLEQKINIFPVLLKLKKQKKTMATWDKSNSSIGGNLKANRSDYSINTKEVLFQKNNESRLMFQHSVQSFQKFKNQEQKKIQEETEIKRSKSFIQKRTSISRSLRSFNSPLYEYKAKAPQPLKKYTQRQLSPNVQKDLTKKYTQLQNRLESILRQARGTKKQNNS